MAVRDDVVGAAIEVCGIGAEDLKDDSTLEDLEIDSLDLIEVGMIMEVKHGIRVSSDDFEDVLTFGDAVDVFERIVSTSDSR